MKSQFGVVWLQAIASLFSFLLHCHWIYLLSHTVLTLGQCHLYKYKNNKSVCVTKEHADRIPTTGSKGVQFSGCDELLVESCSTAPFLKPSVTPLLLLLSSSLIAFMFTGDAKPWVCKQPAMVAVVANSCKTFVSVKLRFTNTQIPSSSRLYLAQIQQCQQFSQQSVTVNKHIFICCIFKSSKRALEIFSHLVWPVHPQPCVCCEQEETFFRRCPWIWLFLSPLFTSIQI